MGYRDFHMFHHMLVRFGVPVYDCDANDVQAFSSIEICDQQGFLADLVTKNRPKQEVTSWLGDEITEHGIRITVDYFCQGKTGRRMRESR